MTDSLNEVPEDLVTWAHGGVPEPRKVLHKWTPEDDEKIKAWAVEGLSTSQIAYKLGHVSRNAVIGRLHRLKFPLGKIVAQRVTKDRIASGKLGSVVAGLRRKQLHGTAKKPKVERPKRKLDGGFVSDGALQALEKTPDMARVARLDDLEPHHCKYPIGDCQVAPMQFCGDQKVPGLPYCVKHAHRCYRPVEPKNVSRETPKLKVVA